MKDEVLSEFDSKAEGHGADENNDTLEKASRYSVGEVSDNAEGNKVLPYVDLARSVPDEFMRTRNDGKYRNRQDGETCDGNKYRSIPSRVAGILQVLMRSHKLIIDPKQICRSPVRGAWMDYALVSDPTF